MASEVGGYLLAITVSTPSLPADVVYKVLDQLEHNVQTLRSAALVCSSWTHPSRRHLFRKIVLRGHNEFEEFSARINTSCIAPYVVSLSLVDLCIRSWVDEFVDIITLLDKLPQVTTLRLSGLRTPNHAPPIALVQPSTQLRHLIITYSVFSNQSAVDTVLRTWSSIRTLAIEWLHIAEPTEGQPVELILQLEELLLVGSISKSLASCLTELLGPSSPSTLRLHTCGFSGLSLAIELTDKIGRRVQELHAEMYYHWLTCAHHKL